jgi:lysophospholipid acyltransferase (LPLAT)-like uncharacterized protein
VSPQPLLSRRSKRHLRRKVGGALLRVLGPPLVRALSWTWKVELVGQEIWARFTDDDSPTRGCMAALWHGRMLLGVDFGRARKFAVLVSPSADGDISERMLAAFGYRVVRGSSSRGGARAVRAMLEELRAGSVVALTPDGPRGPRHAMNPGLAWMSRTTGYPVVPMGLTADRAWHLSSWDAFTIPKPFSRVMLVFGEPVQVARDATPEAMDAATETIRERLLDCERRGFARLGRSVDW